MQDFRVVGQVEVRCSKLALIASLCFVVAMVVMGSTRATDRASRRGDHRAERASRQSTTTAVTCT